MHTGRACVLLMVVMRHAYSQSVCFINGGDEACIQSERVFYIMVVMRHAYSQSVCFI